MSSGKDVESTPIRLQDPRHDQKLQTHLAQLEELDDLYKLIQRHGELYLSENMSTVDALRLSKKIGSMATQHASRARTLTDYGKRQGYTYVYTHGQIAHSPLISHDQNYFELFLQLLLLQFRFPVLHF